MDAQIQSYLRFAASYGRETEKVGPFLATFNPGNDNPYLNYAIPDDGATPSPEDVDSLVAAYERRDRRPRLEYLPSVSPAVEPALVEAGFRVEGRLALMICTPGSERALPVPAGIELIAPASDEELLATATAQHEAYGETAPPTIDGLRRTVEAGGLVVLARDAETGEPAGGGLCSTPHEGLTEVSSIGVRPAFRGRGIAAAMTAWLTREAFAKGVTMAWLTPHMSVDERLYGRAGFETRSEALHISV